jgi:hypothetical protein
METKTAQQKEKTCIICDLKYLPTGTNQKTCCQMCFIKLHRIKRKILYEQNKDKELQQRRENYQKNKDSIKIKNKNYANSHKDKTKASQLKWRYNNKQKIKAHEKINRDIIAGKIPQAKKLSCEKCGKQASVYHHPNYLKKTFVIPLCRECHSEVHKK